MQIRRSRWSKANQIIQQTFGATNEFCRIVQYKFESLIANTVADEAININKEQKTVADKKLNTVADKAINANKK